MDSASHASFEQLVEKGYEKLPDWVRAKIRNVAILIDENPSRAIRKRERLTHNETLLGYYQGIPLTERGDMYGVGMALPDTITLYRLPILTAAQESGIAVEDVVADTIWHECAHHFGMDEHAVRALEREREVGDYRKPKGVSGTS